MAREYRHLPPDEERPWWYFECTGIARDPVMKQFPGCTLHYLDNSFAPSWRRHGKTIPGTFVEYAQYDAFIGEIVTGIRWRRAQKIEDLRTAVATLRMMGIDTNIMLIRSFKP